MEILHALFTPGLGGLEQAYVDVTEALASRGHRVTALLRGDAAYRAEVSRVAAAVVTESPRGFYDVAAVWRLRRVIRRLRPDVIVAHNGRAIALLARAARGTGVPVLGVSHGYKMKHVVKADALVVVSEDMRARFTRGEYEREVFVVPNLVRVPVSPSPSRGEVRRGLVQHSEQVDLPPSPYAKGLRGTQPRPALLQGEGEVVIGALGRFTEEKGFADLLAALQQLHAGGVSFRVRIGGDGPLARVLKEQATGLDVEWLGWVSDKESFYRGIDLLCVPSREESFGLVALEAMARGVPVVATDAPGPVGIITHEVNGLIVPRGDAGAMADALARVMGDAVLAARLGAAGRRRAGDFGFEALAARWDAVIAQVAARRTA